MQVNIFRKISQIQTRVMQDIFFLLHIGGGKESQWSGEKLMVIEGVSMIMVVMGICGKSHKQAHNFVK